MNHRASWSGFTSGKGAGKGGKKKKSFKKNPAVGSAPY
jgi:hypothetical protein